MRRNRSGRASGNRWRGAGQTDPRRNQGRQLEFQPLEDRCLLSSTSISVHKDDGSITLATDTTSALLAGDTVTANSNIGTGPFGQTSGDFDFYKVFIHANQQLTIEINAQSQGSALDSIVAVYDASGNYLDSDDDSPFNMPYTFDSYLQFTPSTGGYYYVAVGQFLLGENIGGPAGAASFPSNPFDSATGPGSMPADQGIYKITMTLAAFTPVAPIAVDDTATTDENTAVAIPVLDNDIDDGILLPSTLSVQMQPTNGKVGVNKTTGIITYTPNAKFVGTDTFTYRVSDYDNLTSNIATVTVTVNQVITPPVAVNDSFTVNEDTPTLLNILANDTDQNATIVPNSVVITTPPQKGTINIDPTTGALTYTPNTGYLGADSFKYTVADTTGAVSNVATVSLNVVPAPPVANPDTATTAENTAVVIPELANDTATGATIVDSSVVIVSQPTQGTATINATTGDITYTPNANYFGPDTIKYTFKDSNGSSSNIGTISITVTFVDYPPVAADDTAQTNPNTAVAIPVLANDTDPNNDINKGSVTIQSGPASGMAVVNAATGVVTYTPNTDFSGTDTFTYTVATTGGAVSNVATVTIHVHQPPIANPDSATTLEETPVSIDVLANDTDPSGATILPSSVTISTQPAHGMVSVDSATGEVQYTPAFNFSGTDTFQYTIADTNGVTSKPGLVTVTVTFVPKPPVAVNDIQGTDENTPVTASVLANDFDYDSPLVPGSVAITAGPLNGTAVVNANGTISYTPNTGFSGADQVTYTVQDALGLTSNPATLDLRVGPPVTLAGVVYVDTNDNGIQDPSEIGIGGVTITLTKTDGPVTFSLTTTSAADGSYNFSETPGVNILPGGTYTLTETPPIYFVDGKDTPGNVSATVTQDQFSNLNLAANQAATGFNFGELGLSAQYVAAFVGRRAFFASSTPTVLNLNLAQGAAYFALSGANQGTFTATAQSSGVGTTTLTLYNSSMHVLTAATLAATAGVSPADASPAVASQVPTTLAWSLSQGAATLLVVSGTNTQVTVTTATSSPSAIPATTPLVTWHNSTNPLDVNGDGSVTPADALAVINALNSQGSGSLGTPPINAHDYLDVQGTGVLSPSDALLIINALNSQSSGAATASVATEAASAAPVSAVVISPAVVSAEAPAAADSAAAGSPVATSDTTTLGQVAFAVATAQAQTAPSAAGAAAASQATLSPAPQAAGSSSSNSARGTPAVGSAAGARSRPLGSNKPKPSMRR